MADALLKEAAETKGKAFVEQLIADKAQYKAAVKEFRKMFILAAVRSTGNNKRKACREFGMHESSLDVMRVRIKTEKSLEVA